MGLMQVREPDGRLFVRGLLLFSADSEGIYGARAEHGGDGVGGNLRFRSLLISPKQMSLLQRTNITGSY